MKIMLISPHPGFGGASTANHMIAQMLHDAGHEVIYIDEYCDTLLLQKKRYFISNFSFHKNRFLGQCNSYKYIMDYNPDYILVGNPFVGVYYFLLFLFLSLKGKRIGYIFHSLGLGYKLKDRLFDWLISYSTVSVSDLIFVSVYTKISWQQFLPIRIKAQNSYVIHNAVEIPYISNESISDRKMKNIIFVGRFSIEKRPLLFCQLANKLYASYHFIMWGNGVLFNQLSKKYAEFVDFKGFSSNINEIYKDADLLVVTSAFENCPMCILEAQSMGIPCVAPLVGGIPEIVTDGVNGKLFTDWSIDKISLCIDEISTHYMKYVKNTLKTRLTFSCENIMNDWNKLLHK